MNTSSLSSLSNKESLGAITFNRSRDRIFHENKALFIAFRWSTVYRYDKNREKVHHVIIIWLVFHLHPIGWVASACLLFFSFISINKTRRLEKQKLKTNTMCTVYQCKRLLRLKENHTFSTSHIFSFHPNPKYYFQSYKEFFFVSFIKRQTLKLWVTFC